MKKTVWVYWENLHKNVPEPAYIKLSRWTMLQNLTDCSLVIVNPDNLEKYLPGVHSILSGIEVDIKGQLDRSFRKLGKRCRKNVAVKCDVIRALLLYHYGGIYIDSDAIVLGSFGKYFDVLTKHDFFIVQRQTHGQSHVSIGFYGCNPKTEIMRHYIYGIYKKLQTCKEVTYVSLGASLLTPIVEKFAQRAKIFDEDEAQPITCEDARTKFIDESLKPEQVFGNDQKIFMLFNGPFQGKLKNIGINELYNGDYFISKVFRKALSRDEFNKFQFLDVFEKKNQ